jgi:hypothetical protein
MAQKHLFIDESEHGNIYDSGFNKRFMEMKLRCTCFFVFILLALSGYTQNQVKNACAESTYIKLLGKPGVVERGLSLTPSDDGNLYVVGSDPENAIITKIDPDGKIIWSRTLDILPGYDNIIDFIVDNEGMIVAIGASSPSFQGYSAGFLLKYNPQSDQVLWQQEFNFQIGRIAGIYQRTSSGNYFICFTSIFFDPGPVIKEIDQDSGEEIPTSNGRYYTPGDNIDILSCIFEDSYAYMTGRVSGKNGRKNILAKVDLNNKTVSWSRYGHLDDAFSTQLEGFDLLKDGDHLISAHSGNDSISSLIPGYLFLQKTNVSDGTVEWVKKYDLTDIRSERALHLIKSFDGYVVWGRAEAFNSNQDTLFLLKTDFDGALIWSKIFDYSENDYSTLNIFSHDQLIDIDSSLYFTAYTEDDQGSLDLLLAKLDSNGEVGDSCAYLLPTPVIATTVSNPASVPAGMEYSDFLWEEVRPLLPLPVSTSFGNAQFESICEDICPDDLGDPCDVKTNGCVVFEMLDVTQDNNGDLRYRVRFTNNCTGQELRYLAIELPKGTVAVGPVNGSTYITPNGRSFSVRNPNFSPFYSIRFKGGLGPGESDVFEYTLKGFSRPKYFNVLSRLWPGPSYEAHLNVFNCPIQSNTQTAQSRASGSEWIEEVMLAPNPVADVLSVSAPNLSDNGQWEIFSIDGKSMRVGALSGGTSISIPVLEFQEGVYLIRMPMNDGTIVMKRFVKAR